MPEECQVTLPLLSEFQPPPPEQVKRGSASACGPRGVVRDPGGIRPGLSGFPVSLQTLAMGNTSSERAALERQAGHKTPRRDSGGAKDGDRPKILMDSPEDADIFHSEEIKVLSRGASEPS